MNFLLSMNSSLIRRLLSWGKWVNWSRFLGSCLSLNFNVWPLVYQDIKCTLNGWPRPISLQQAFRVISAVRVHVGVVAISCECFCFKVDASGFGAFSFILSFILSLFLSFFFLVSFLIVCMLALFTCPLLPPVLISFRFGRPGVTQTTAIAWVLLLERR